MASIVFLAFTSYDQTLAGAEAEALAVTQQFETAQFMPSAVTPQLGAELICNGRYVKGAEWPRVEKGLQTSDVNHWVSRCSVRAR